jgi:hypothetical protein
MWIFIVIIAVGVIAHFCIMSKLTPEQRDRANARRAKVDTALLLGSYVASKGITTLSKTPKRYRAYH